MPAAVTVGNLWKRYQGVDALRGVTFEIGTGEVFGLLGPNGAGKTTALECLVGLREPDAGEINICGFDARRQLPEVKQRIGVMPQSTSLQDKITPREALRLFGSFYRRQEDVPSLLQRFALTAKADARFDTLSGGQRQRLALALALVNRPDLVMLDEPTAGLDPQARRELMDFIGRMKKDGCTVLFTTHDLAEAELLCDRVAIMDRGAIVATGAPRELVRRTAGRHRVTLATSDPLPPDRVAALAGVCDVDFGRGGHGRAGFQTNDVTATLEALTRLLRETKAGLLELRISRASLEDVFLGLTRGEKPDGTPGSGSA